ncbi:calcium-activated potassium channel subunit alpha-1 [Thraustotheca clavata]|uniref:Calcium-activated potassium channel subunit alpha-1 n=1 Tax=Thraustotheca clavata TaxID=74557 RepID=A0A1W0AB57_9STRA|nr:calcium-activated potassium channel subunit alpha-1 [Thraustotheca clavata]
MLRNKVTLAVEASKMRDLTVDLEPPKGMQISKFERRTKYMVKNEQTRIRINRFLDNGPAGLILDILESLVAIAFAISYIVLSYSDEPALTLVQWNVELGCALFFLADFIFRGILLAESWKGIFHWDTFVNMVIIFPVFPAAMFVPTHTFWQGTGYYRMIYPMRFLKCSMEIRAVLNRCRAYMSPVMLFGLVAYFRFLSVIFVAAGVIQITETSIDSDSDATDDGDWTFFNSLFKSILTFVYVDYPPAENPISKVIVGTLLVFLLIIIPYELSKLFDINSLYSSYEHDSYNPSKRSKHIVICGDLTPQRIEQCFWEIFHDDHDLVDIRVVAMCDEPPPSSMVALLMDPFFAKRAVYIQGSVLDSDAAMRAACDSAAAIFVLTRKTGHEDLNSSDHRTIMRAIEVQQISPNASIYTQIHLSANRHLLEASGITNVLCLSEVMHALLAQNCFCPGFSTLMFNLTAALSDVKVDHTWESRFLHGASHELYSVTLPPANVVYGMTFAEVAVMVHAQCKSAILLAIFVNSPDEDPNSTENSCIILNPGNTYVCHGNETAYVIARDRRQAELVSRMEKEVYVGGSGHSMSESQGPKISLQSQNAEDKVLSPSSGMTKEKAKLYSSNPPKRHPGPRKKRTARTIMWAASKLAEASGKNKKVEECIIDDVGKLKFALKPIIAVSLSSTFPENLEFFIAPLRAPTVKDHHPVVILTPAPPLEETFAPLKNFIDVFVVVGEPTRLGVLKRCGIEMAFKVVILCSEEDFGTESNQLLADATTIAVHKSITSMLGPHKAPMVVTKLVNRSNVNFISHNLKHSGWFDQQKQSATLTDTVKFLCSPSFASGLTYSTELCDNLIVNHFFNPMIQDIVRELVFSPLRGSKLFPGKSKFSAFERNLASTGLLRSSLFTCELPLDFVGKTFAYCFEYLLMSDAILTLGVYRCLPLDMIPVNPISPPQSPIKSKARIEKNETDRAVPFGFVYLNPLPTEIMTGNDLLYVLSHKQPCWA